MNTNIVAKIIGPPGSPRRGTNLRILALSVLVLLALWIPTTIWHLLDAEGTWYELPLFLSLFLLGFALVSSGVYSLLNWYDKLKEIADRRQ